MSRSIIAALAFIVVGLAPAQTVAAVPPVIGLDASAPDSVEAKRDTCWRTNRSTGQKFRIC